MPPLLVPHRSGVHRTACFALFRALLRQKRRLPLDERRRLSMNGTLEAAFKQNASLTSPKRIIGALRLGYETLKLFRRFDENPDHLRRIFELIATPTPCMSSPLIDASPKAGRRRPRAPRPPPHVWPQPNNKPVLSRPFLKLTGRRHVPRLVVGRKTPFLLFKKPQSPYLTRIIRDRSDEREKGFIRRDELQNQILLGKEEDRWDMIVESICGLQCSDEEWPWKKASFEAFKQGAIIGRRRENKALVIATKMQKIVEQEQALSDMEKSKRRHDKSQIRTARKKVTVAKRGAEWPKDCKIKQAHQ